MKKIRAKKDYNPWCNKGTIIPPSKKGACINDGKINPEHKGYYSIFRIGSGFLTVPSEDFEIID
jgi:hypothetical protein